MERKSRLGFPVVNGVYISVVSTLSLIVAILVATQVITVGVDPEIRGPSYKGQSTGDWLGPFFLHGSRAVVSWMPTEGIIQPGEEAQLCYAENRTCLDVFLEVGKGREFDLRSGEPVAEGWYYLLYTRMTGTMKTYEVYLYD
jgi:hypothetical protein